VAEQRSIEQGDSSACPDEEHPATSLANDLQLVTDLSGNAIDADLLDGEVIELEVVNEVGKLPIYVIYIFVINFIQQPSYFIYLCN